MTQLQRRVILVRGLPGSGKSTWIREQIKDLQEGSFAWCSNDHHFEENDITWSDTELKTARAKMKAKVDASYADPAIERIFIDNVHAVLKSIDMSLAGIAPKDVHVIDFTPRDAEFHHRRTVHNVPLSSIKQMLASWDRISFTGRFGYVHTRMQSHGD